MTTDKVNAWEANVPTDVADELRTILDALPDDYTEADIEVRGRLVMVSEVLDSFAAE